MSSTSGSFDSLRGPGGLTLRAALESDVPLLAELFNLAFPGERTVEERARGLREGGVYGGVESTFLAEQDGVPAGAFRAYRLILHLHGRRWPTLGLASVAVSPSFRRRGIGRWMCREALRLGRERGDLLSALYPFRVSFYAGLGYTLAGEYHRYRVPLSELALSPGWERVQWMPRGETGALEEVYGRVAARSNGLVERTERMWEFVRRERFSAHVYLDDAGVPRGYLVASFRRGAAGRTVLRVREMLAEDPEAYDGLMGWVAAQRDQAGEAIVDTLPGEDFHLRLSHPRRPRSAMQRDLWFPSATVLRGPMLRVLDPLRVAVESGADPSSATGVSTEDPAAVAGFTRAFLEGRLPGQREPEGWSPALGLRDFRLLDAF